MHNMPCRPVLSTTYNINIAATPAPTPSPALTTALPAATPELVADAALPLAEVVPLLTVACATCTPKLVDVLAVPETVVVTTEVAVVDAAHPVQVVHGALDAQGPLVQPDQVDAGQAEPPHQDVQGAEVHAPEEAQGPHPLLLPALPKGP